MPISLIKEEEKHILRILPVLLKRDREFKDSLYEVLGETFVKTDDFSELKEIVKDLGVKVGELANAQKQTEEKVSELANTQIEMRKELKELANVQKELAENQKKSEERLTRVEDELTLFRRTFISQIGGIGARWGIMAENSFRNAMEEILADIGFKTERFKVKDKEGIVYGYPEDVELDVVIQDGKVFVIEIKSSISREEVYTFNKKVGFYQDYTKNIPKRKMIVSPYVERYAMDVAKKLNIEVFTDINEVA